VAQIYPQALGSLSIAFTTRKATVEVFYPASTRDRTLEVAVAVNLRPTVSRPVCPGVRRPSGTYDQFFFLLEISFRQLRLCYFVALSLTRGRVCNLPYNCFWALQEQSLLGRSPAEHAELTVSSETPPNWRARFSYLYPPGTRWPSYTPGHWGGGL
jgi:hypothetical protein